MSHTNRVLVDNGEGLFQARKLFIAFVDAVREFPHLGLDLLNLILLALVIAAGPCEQIVLLSQLLNRVLGVLDSALKVEVASGLPALLAGNLSFGHDTGNRLSEVRIALAEATILDSTKETIFSVGLGLHISIRVVWFGLVWFGLVIDGLASNGLLLNAHYNGERITWQSCFLRQRANRTVQERLVKRVALM